MKKFIKKLLSIGAKAKLKAERVVVYFLCVRRIKNQMHINGFENRPVEGEDDYKAIWKKLSKRVEPYSYRLFSHYISDRRKWKYIVPEDIAHNIVDYYLCPPQYREFYSDKNSYSMYLGDTIYPPKTILCRIGGGGF